MSKRDNAQPPSIGWLNKKDMAASLRISVQAFDKWGVEPVARIGRSVYFDARQVLDHKLAELEAKHQPGATGEEEIDPLLEYRIGLERKRLLAAQADGQEQKNQVTARQMVPVDFATYALSKMAPQVATILDTLPLTMKRKHPDLEARHLDTLSRELAKARNKAVGLDDLLPGLLDDYIDANT